MKTIQKEEISLSKEFIDQIKKTIKPHWGPLGWVTYKRTYARYLPEKRRTENWDETVKRTVEGNINLDPRLQHNPSQKTKDELTQEAQKLFRLIYGLGATPSGRNLWISGTKYQQEHGDALNNCWFIAIRPQAYGNSQISPEYLTQDQVAVSMPFSFMFDQLMKGGGVGFSVTQNNIKQLPAVDNAINLTILISHTSKAYAETIEMGAQNKEQWLADHAADNYDLYKLPDTREGWVLANATLIDHHFSSTNITGVTHLVLDISQIRARGAAIHGFGGTASGPAPLVEMLFDINQILNNKVEKKLSSVDCTDIGNLIGKTVVAGNVRRSAELALGSADDHAFITMKQDQDKLYHHRWASNNSVAVDSNFDNYDEVADALRKNGEPGIVNLDLSKNYGRVADGRQAEIDPDVEGTNPCGEISLANGEPCNLFEVFPGISTQQGWDLQEVFTLGTRFAKRVTFSHYDWEISRTIIAKNRRIGISMSGIQDWILSEFGNRVVRGFDEDNDPATGEKIKRPVYDQKAVHRVTQLYQAVVQADKEYSQTLNCAPSLKHTTVKPSGTVAKLAGTSEGMHFHYAGYLIQRIRFQDNDPLLLALNAAGYHMEPDVYTKNTMCVEFPMRAPHADDAEFASAGTVSIAEQFATQAFLQEYWSDNAVSCTITFQPEEGSKISKLLSQYRFITKSTSLLPYSGANFKQAPKEPIDKKLFEQKSAEIKQDVQTTFERQNQDRDKEGFEIVGQEDCEGGACPVK
ncbi:ribonucleoside-triphosphate reductase, adenosylcobalamin-dependent [Lactiplantibacillus plantarum]|uniref:ribonucleoside-triphosphate reductase, adenosylcobalamin-dependent n=1 Tax=Lactiplantibacillus plantarum TaxID=1590 RepID=UPI000BE45BFE|nr:ribonucleoside-triphosphate reductase, adenosylcobalamin-dependent [Lactiplantibacillus plantarum]QRQ99302.1 Adenosylcobalamin-dependent ribonucleoside-triphosphate reductase [Lactiplantibacillus plantarum]